MRYLAIDHGQKRTGLAVSDGGGTMAFPYGMIPADSRMIAAVKDVIQKERIDAVVIGLPLNMNGSEGPRAAAVRAFAQQLGKAVSIPIVFCDERLSSYEAEQKLGQLNLSDIQKKQKVDATAATLILQRYIDSQSQPNSVDCQSISLDDQLRYCPDRLVVPDSAAAAEQVSITFQQAAEEAIEQRGAFHAVLSGGKTPAAFFDYAAAVQSEAMRSVWQKTHFFWADERAVAPDDPQSNYGLAHRTMLSHLPIPADHIHRMPADSADLEKAAWQYEQTIRQIVPSEGGKFPVFDWVLLGLGADGHTASLMPCDAALDNYADTVAVVRSPQYALCRLTLTIPVLLSARSLVLMICGSEKADIVRSILCEPPDIRCHPICALHPAISKTLWIMDTQAASLLQED